MARAMGKDLSGWSVRRRNRKVARLASVIVQIIGGRLGPAGVCEVENRFVLDLLAAVAKRFGHCTVIGDQRRGLVRRRLAAEPADLDS
jgi:hypothetical protein